MPPDGDATAAMADRRRLRLAADCGSCFGLCCVALPFSASADFPVDKGAGEPCRNLQPDFRCGVHTALRGHGFRGCATYDCFGAGQQVSQVVYRGQSWRQEPRSAGQMFAVFGVVRALHELLWYLLEALALEPAWPLHADLRILHEQTERLAGSAPEELLALDVAAHREAVAVLLRGASELARAEAAGGAPEPADLSGAELFGARLRGADLRAVSLRGAYLIGADLRGADLRGADLIGADLRDTDLRGADLTGCLFLTQPQLDAATGGRTTVLPSTVVRPAHWSPDRQPVVDRR